jgi:hypothetical protein
MRERIQPVTVETETSNIQSTTAHGRTVMKTILATAFSVLILAGISGARELPDAPSSSSSSSDSMFVEAPVTVPSARIVESKPVDLKFVSLALISTGASFSDSYTTLFARQNWLAGKKGVCNVEVQSPYLYGTHPTVARAYTVASAKSAGSILVAYYLRKHHSKFWSAPLIANSIIGLEGTTQNMMNCN